ncbi:hypothetical protein [Vibrio breoganii]|uniref:hypothetical protein n=1 Tax=Vibrio breoganii TaxID=553239 RepID=UPI000C85033E|nr:hypothetical protein [Vibrio breoganii]PMM20307.1 hypothetical protein BCT59_07715 [Vibrio breoganii]
MIPNKSKVPSTDELLQEMRIRVGLEQAPKQAPSAFAQELPQVQAPQQPQANWNPEERAVEVEQKVDDHKFADALMTDPIFSKMVQKLDPLLDEVGAEVLNPESPFGPQEAEEMLVAFIQAELDKEAFDA